MFGRFPCREAKIIVPFTFRSYPAVQLLCQQLIRAFPPETIRLRDVIFSHDPSACNHSHSGVHRSRDQIVPRHTLATIHEEATPDDTVCSRSSARSPRRECTTAPAGRNEVDDSRTTECNGAGNRYSVPDLQCAAVRRAPGPRDRFLSAAISPDP